MGVRERESERLGERKRVGRRKTAAHPSRRNGAEHGGITARGKHWRRAPPRGTALADGGGGGGGGGGDKPVPVRLAAMSRSPRRPAVQRDRSCRPDPNPSKRGRWPPGAAAGGGCEAWEARVHFLAYFVWFRAQHD